MVGNLLSSVIDVGERPSAQPMGVGSAAVSVTHLGGQGGL